MLGVTYSKLRKPSHLLHFKNACHEIACLATHYFLQERQFLPGEFDVLQQQQVVPNKLVLALNHNGDKLSYFFLQFFADHKLQAAAVLVLSLQVLTVPKKASFLHQLIALRQSLVSFLCILAECQLICRLLKFA